MSNSQRTAIRIVVVDDDPIVRESLWVSLSQMDDIVVLGAAASAGEALTLIAGRDDVDVVLMDVRMPDQDGLDASRRILGQGGPSPRVLLLTALDDGHLANEALAAGANGLILKSSGARGIADAVRAVCSGHTVFSEHARAQLGGRTNPIKPPRLSDRERQVLELICRGLSTAEVAKRLHVSESRVKAHVSTLMDRLHVDSRLKVVVRAFEWRLVPPAVSGP